MVRPDKPDPMPRKASRAGTESFEDNPCRYSSGSTSVIFRRLAAPGRQDRRSEPPTLAGFLVDAANHDAWVAGMGPVVVPATVPEGLELRTFGHSSRSPRN
jgi:hypothetical protein